MTSSRKSRGLLGGGGVHQSHGRQQPAPVAGVKVVSTSGDALGRAGAGQDDDLGWPSAANGQDHHQVSVADLPSGCSCGVGSRHDGWSQAWRRRRYTVTEADTAVALGSGG